MAAIDAMILVIRHWLNLIQICLLQIFGTSPQKPCNKINDIKRFYKTHKHAKQSSFVKSSKMYKKSPIRKRIHLAVATNTNPGPKYPAVNRYSEDRGLLPTCYLREQVQFGPLTLCLQIMA